MTLTKGQAKVKFSLKWAKIKTTGHISDAIALTHFILDTKIQPNKAHVTTQVPMTLTEGPCQGQISKKANNLNKHQYASFRPQSSLQYSGKIRIKTKYILP